MLYENMFITLHIQFITKLSVPHPHSPLGNFSSTAVIQDFFFGSLLSALCFDFFYISQMIYAIQPLYVSFQLHPLSIISFSSILVANGRISSIFNNWVVFYCVYNTYLFTFLSLTFSSFLYLSYCDSAAITVGIYRLFKVIVLTFLH